MPAGSIRGSGCVVFEDVLMRAEAEAHALQIKQALDLLRRFL
jgi:hypothetical protein